MGNVNLPTPVALAGGAFCILGGYLLGVVAGPDTATRTTAEVASYDPATSRLCLEGDGIEGQEGTVKDGLLCGTWRRTGGDQAAPRPGDSFRFVSLSVQDPEHTTPEGQQPATVIYGSLVP
ncbi:MAG: hypothetical protein ACTHKG_03945 [Nocardioides sp.]